MRVPASIQQESWKLSGGESKSVRDHYHSALHTFRKGFGLEVDLLLAAVVTSTKSTTEAQGLTSR